MALQKKTPALLAEVLIFPVGLLLSVYGPDHQDLTSGVMPAKIDVSARSVRTRHSDRMLGHPAPSVNHSQGVALTQSRAPTCFLTGRAGSTRPFSLDPPLVNCVLDWLHRWEGAAAAGDLDS